MPAIQIKSYPVRVYPPPLVDGQPPVVSDDPEPDTPRVTPVDAVKVLLAIIGVSIAAALVLWGIRTAPRPIEWVNVGCGVAAFLFMAGVGILIFARRTHGRA